MSLDISSFVDRSFDAAFDELRLDSLPWVGLHFQQARCRTIVLGESVYDYSRKGAPSRLSEIEEKDSLRRRHAAWGVLGTKKRPYLNNFERAVFLTRNPSRAARQALWNQVVFHNLVGRVLNSRKQRPTASDYCSGWQQFLSIAELAAARRCVVYGLERAKIDALLEVCGREQARVTRFAAVGDHRPVKVQLALRRGQLELFFIRHPSAFFDWAGWGQALRAAEMLPIHDTATGGGA